MKPARAKPPRFYFSLRSPYSWLAHHELTTRYPHVAARLEWRPFWEPDKESARRLEAAGGRFPYTPMSKEKHLYTLQDVRRIARRHGLDPRWPVDREPVWEVPHLAYMAAERYGKGREFVGAASRARFEDGRDICDPGVVADLAAGLGLPPEELATAAGNPSWRDAGVDALLELCRDGVFGVPYFLLGYNRFWGVDRLPDLVAEMARADDRGRAAEGGRPAGSQSASSASLPRRAATAELALVDDGHAGGCG